MKFKHAILVVIERWIERDNVPADFWKQGMDFIEQVKKGIPCKMNNFGQEVYRTLYTLGVVLPEDTYAKACSMMAELIQPPDDDYDIDFIIYNILKNLMVRNAWKKNKKGGYICIK